MLSPASFPPVENLFEGDEAVRGGYARLLPLEGHLSIKILAQMLLQAPSLAGRTYIAGCINDCATDQEIVELGEFHLSHFIKYFKDLRASSTASSCFAPRELQIDSLTANPTVHAEAKEQGLIRDSHRCMLSGVVDSDAFESLSDLRAEVKATKATVKVTECCHILPECVSDGVEGLQHQGGPDLWTFARFFGDIPEHQLSGPAVHDLRNVLTLECGIHTCFKELVIWLEATGTEHQYTIGRREEYYCSDLPDMVTFSSASPDLPLPDPRYLALHAAFGRILKLSGAAEYIENILDDSEEIKALLEAGSSG